jgi:ADP-ribose pyrophosphatase YjhB (NUDIX family)
MTKRFNIRVYGLLIEQDQVLLSDEFIRGAWYTKFPGGGLEFGEGTTDCVVREFQEELVMEVRCLSHFYTTDFFAASAFDESQIISIYYLVERVGESATLLMPADSQEQRFRWCTLSDLKEEHLSLIIDKKVASLLLKS